MAVLSLIFRIVFNIALICWAVKENNGKKILENVKIGKSLTPVATPEGGRTLSKRGGESLAHVACVRETAFSCDFRQWGLCLRDHPHGAVKTGFGHCFMGGFSG
jgi:hypothetical protein